MNHLSYIFLYLDPGTGSLIIQLIITAVTAAIFFIRGLRQRVIDLFNRLRGKDKKES